MSEKNSIEFLKTKLAELIESPECELCLNSNFYDNGGNSLVAILFIEFISRQFAVDVTIKDLFELDLKDLASHIDHEVRISNV